MHLFHTKKENYLTFDLALFVASEFKGQICTAWGGESLRQGYLIHVLIRDEMEKRSKQDQTNNQAYTYMYVYNYIPHLCIWPWRRAPSLLQSISGEQGLTPAGEGTREV